MRPLYIQRYLITGLLTFIPIWLTWAVFKFIFSLLSQVNVPLVAAMFSTLAGEFPETIGQLNQGWLVSFFAFVVTVVALYITGWAASHVFGRRMIAIYRRTDPAHPACAHDLQRHQEADGTHAEEAGRHAARRADRLSIAGAQIGRLRDACFSGRVGRELAAVYVPTTPNPTGGYLEIVPIERLISTDWTVDQAMAFILSAGAAAPDMLPFNFERPPPVVPPAAA